MYTPFPHSISGATTGDFPLAVSYTALLNANDDDLFDDFPNHKPFLLPPPPPPETLESLIPPSVLSGYIFSDPNLQIPSFPRSISPRKRALDFSSSHFEPPMLDSTTDFPPPLLPSLKSPRLEPQSPFPPPAPPTLDSIMTGFSLSDFVDALMAVSAQDTDIGAPSFSSMAEKGKRRLKENDRRKNLSEKFKRLGNLLPGATKLCTADMLEAAHSYIRFLQAQVQALQSMPAQSAYAVVPNMSTPSLSGVAGLLGGLTRQQLLQAVVNSPAAQAVMSSEKRCVVSTEQVLMLKKMLYQSLTGGVGGAWMGCA